MQWVLILDYIKASGTRANGKTCMSIGIFHYKRFTVGLLRLSPVRPYDFKNGSPFYWATGAA